MSRKNVIRRFAVAFSGLVGIILIVAATFAWTSSSSDAVAAARTAAVDRGFQADELELRNLKVAQHVGGLLGEEGYVEFAVKDSEPLRTVRVDVSRNAFQRSWQAQMKSVPAAGR